MSVDILNGITGSPDRDIPCHPPVIPEGYHLTTRLMRHRYYHPVHGCPPGEHTHPEHTAFWPTRGTDSVEVEGVIHQLSVGGGVWVPAGVRHRVDRSPSATLAAVHILPQAWVGPEFGVVSLHILPALRELLLHLAESPMAKPRRLRAQRVCLELIAEEQQPRYELIVPQDERIAGIAQAIMEDPANDRSLEEWAWHASLSSRTIARAFRDTTGMTFNEWRACVRVSLAIDLLGDGLPVGAVARRVGYGSIGAFSNAFYRVVGRRPTEFHPHRA